MKLFKKKSLNAQFHVKFNICQIRQQIIKLYFQFIFKLHLTCNFIR